MMNRSFDTMSYRLLFYALNYSDGMQKIDDINQEALLSGGKTAEISRFSYPSFEEARFNLRDIAENDKFVCLINNEKYLAEKKRHVIIFSRLPEDLQIN